MKQVFCIILLFTGVYTFAQKKILDHPDFEIWNTIQRQTIAGNGNFIMYSLQKGEKDSHLKIKDKKANLVFDHERSEQGNFTYDSKFAIFTDESFDGNHPSSVGSKGGVGPSTKENCRPSIKLNSYAFIHMYKW